MYECRQVIYSLVCEDLESIFFSTFQEKCTLTINTNHQAGGIYAVAVTIEDRPKTDITLDGKLYTPNDVISSVPLQVGNCLLVY